jgi:hypothetical protein
MEEAELYFKQAKSTGSWGKKSSSVDTMYAFQAIRDDDPECIAKMDGAINNNLLDLSLFTA